MNCSLHTEIKNTFIICSNNTINDLTNSHYYIEHSSFTLQPNGPLIIAYQRHCILLLLLILLLLDHYRTPAMSIV